MSVANYKPDWWDGAYEYLIAAFPDRPEPATSLSADERQPIALLPAPRSQSAWTGFLDWLKNRMKAN